MALLSSETIHKMIHRILIVLLGGHTIYSMWESLQFFVLEYGVLEAKLAAHTATQDELNLAIIEAGVLVFFTSLSGWFTYRLQQAHLNDEAAETIDLVISTILLLSSSFATQYLLQFNLFVYIAHGIQRLL